jgi:hypothetical protein
MFPQLTNVRLGLPANKLDYDLKLSGYVITQIRTATLPEDKITGPARVGQKDDLTSALATRYIGAVKVLSYQKGQMVGTDGFKGGKAQVVVMLFDRQTSKPVYADLVTATNDATIDVKYFKDKPLTQESGQAWVDLNLERNLRAEVLKKFASGTGGIFEKAPSFF